jgi:hypothetical protein
MPPASYRSASAGSRSTMALAVGADAERAHVDQVLWSDADRRDGRPRHAFEDVRRRGAPRKQALGGAVLPEAGDDGIASRDRLAEKCRIGKVAELVDEARMAAKLRQR